MPLNIEHWTISTSAYYLAIIVILITIVRHFFRSRGVPPGPTGLPYIGYWPFFKADTIHHQLNQLSKKYGDVFSFTVTGRLFVALNTLNAIREVVLKKQQYFERRVSDFSVLKYFFRDAFEFADEEEWKVLRVFYIQQFKELGMTSFKDDKCGPIYKCVKDCVDELEKAGGRPLDITDVITRASCTIFRTLMFADDENPEITYKHISDVCNSYEIMLENMNGLNLLLVGDIAKYFIHPFTKGYRLAMEHFGIITENLFKMVEKHKSTFNEDNVRNTIYDRYFKERIDRASRNDPTAKYFTDRALVAAMFQFIGDGVQAGAVFVCAFLQALLDHPEEQEKIYNEVLEVVGTDRDPCMDDKSKLPYTNAFILEVVRMCEVFPFIVQLECTRETTLQGYKIPEGCVALVNTWGAHHDPNEYEEPEKFNPSRYITEKGKRKPEAPILFGIGRRSCIGEGYSMAQAFLFVATIVKNFRLTKAPSSEEDKQILFLSGKLIVCAQPRRET